MSEPVEKAKRKRRRSARFYISMNHPPDPAAVAALAALFPSDRDDDDQPAPAGRRMAKPETEKHMNTGNPHDCPDYNSDRPSEPLVANHQSPSPGGGDHGVGAGRPHGIASAFMDLRQSTVQVTPLATLNTVTDPSNGDRSIIYQRGTAALSRLDASAAAPFGGPVPSGNPLLAAGRDHIARNSATPPDGTHGLTDPLSHAAPAATKGAPVGGYVAMEMLRQVAREAMNREP